MTTVSDDNIMPQSITTKHSSEQQNYFYSTFLDLYNKNDTIPIEQLDVISISTDELPRDPLNDPGFRRDLLKHKGPSIELLHLLKPNLIKTIIKPQRLIQDEPDFYIAIDLMTNTYYICYRTLLMLDIDFYKLKIGPLASLNNGVGDKAPHTGGGFLPHGENNRSKGERKREILDDLEKYTVTHPDILFRTFESRNGIHAFIVSKPCDYQNDETSQLSIDLNSDFYYTIYASIRGWSVRLNRKKSDQWPLYSFIKDIGTASPDPHLEKLIVLHLKLCDCFKNTGCNLMHDG